MSALKDSLALLFYAVVWYALLVACNVYTKHVLELFPLPCTVTMSNLGLGLLYIVPVWSLGYRPPPKVQLNDVAALVPVAAFHAVATTMTNASMKSGPLFLTLTVKAAETIVSTLAAVAVAKRREPKMIHLALIPIAVGVVIVSVLTVNDKKEGSKHDQEELYVCIASAMVANVAFALRGIMSKKARIKSTPQNHLTPANVFALLVVLSFIIMIPVCYVLEGDKMREKLDQAYAASRDKYAFQQEMLIAGLTYYLCNEAAYLVLGSSTANSPYTNTLVGGPAKRAVVVVASIVYLKEDVSDGIILGGIVMLAGDVMFAVLRTRQQGARKRKRAKKITPRSSPTQEERGLEPESGALKPRKISFDAMAEDHRMLNENGGRDEMSVPSTSIGDFDATLENNDFPARRRRKLSFERFKNKRKTSSEI